MPDGALQETKSVYNRDAAAGEDTQYLTLGGLQTGINGEALDAAGKSIEGLYAVGTCAAHISQSGKSYASSLSLSPGSFFGCRTGRRMVT